ARLGRPVAICGQGWVGKAATVSRFRQLGIDRIPGDGFLPATVPAAFGTWAYALMHFGTLTLRDVLEPALEYTGEGFPMYPGLRNSIAGLARKFREQWPTSAAVYLPDNRVPAVGEVFRNPDWAATLKRVVDVELRERRRGREGAIQAAIDFWYKGDAAERLVAFLQNTAILDASGKKNRGLLSKEDFAEWRPTQEPPLSVPYRGLDVFKCGPWTQGPVFL